MKLLQFYYTSCKKGQSAGAGFQIYAASEGLTDEELRELEQISLYIAPDHLPSQPSAHDIEQLFPVKFSSFRLQSGRYGICQSVYVGQDYSGRFGNYFSHALVLESGQWPMAPISFYKSPIFRKNLTADEQNIEQTPGPLPPLHLESADGLISYSHVQTFLRQNDRYTYLKQMLNSLMTHEGSPASTVIIAPLDEVPYWIAALQYSFPLQIGNNLSFSTYVYDPERANYTIIATPDEGTRFSFRDINRYSNMDGFDFLNEQFSEVDYSYRYPEKVTEHELIDKRWDDFFQGFKLDFPTADLDAFLDLMSFLEGSAQNDLPVMQSAFQFLEKYGDDKNIRKFMEVFQQSNAVTINTDLAATKYIMEQLIKITERAKSSNHETITAQFFLDKVIDFMTDSFVIDDVVQFVNTTLTQMESTGAVYELFFQDENLRWLQHQLIEMNDLSKDEFYLQFAIKLLVNEQVLWEQLTPEQQQFLRSLSEQCFANHLLANDYRELLSQAPNIFAGIVREINQMDSYAFQNEFLYTHVLQIIEANFSDDHWLKTLTQHVDSADVIQEILEVIFSDHLKQCVSIHQMGELLFKATQIESFDLTILINDFEQSLKQAQAGDMNDLLIILKNERLRNILTEKNALLSILNVGEHLITFTDEAIEDQLATYEQLAQYSSENGVVNSLYELVAMTYTLKESRKKDYERFERMLLNQSKNNFSHVSDQTIQAYTSWSLQVLIELIYTKKKRQTELIQQFVYKYPTLILNALTTRRQKLKSKQLHLLLADLFIGLHAPTMPGAARSQMITYLCENDRLCKKVNETLNKQPSWKKKWQSMYDDIQKEKRHPVTNFVKNIFRSKK